MPDPYRSLFERSAAAQLLVRSDRGTIVEANQAAAEFYGRPREQLTGIPLGSLGPDDSALESILEVGASIGVHLSGIVQRHASGDTRPVEMYGSPVDDGVVHLIIHDVSERVRAEARARELHADQVARARTEELREEVRRQQTMARMGQVVAGVAHEVRNPLFAISSLIDAARQRLGGHADFARIAPMLDAQVERLSDLMRDLLDYGRPSALTRQDTTVRLIAESAGSLVTQFAADAGVQLRTTFELPPDGVVSVDRMKFGQVVVNLLSNAIQHAPPGSVVEQRWRRAAHADAIELEVQDDGPGFPSDVLPHAFEPFVTRRPGGTGLGLALAYRTVTEHGATITAANRLGASCEVLGAVVTVRLPVPPLSPASPRP